MDAVWLLPPDWKSAPRVTDAWKTGVNITPLGNEARSALIAYPRLTLSYSAKILSYRHRAWLMRSLFKHLHKVWGVPVWTDVTLLTVPAAAGDTRITVANTVLRRFHAGGKLVLIDAADDLHHAACTIADVEDGAITLSEPVSEDWPAAYVYPLVTAQMSATQNITSITSHYATLKVDFTEVLETPAVALADPEITVETWKDEDLFLIRPNWIELPVFSITHVYRQVAFFGVSATDTLAQESTISLKGRWSGMDRGAAWALRAFFMRQKGRFGRFWLPSWHADVVVTTPIAATDTVIEIADIDYESAWFSNLATGKHLIFFLPGLDPVCRTVTAVDGNRLTLDQALGEAVEEDDLKFLMVSFLLFVRFDQDGIAGVYSTESLVHFEMRFITLPFEAPE